MLRESIGPGWLESLTSAGELYIAVGTTFTEANPSTPRGHIVALDRSGAPAWDEAVTDTQGVATLRDVAADGDAVVIVGTVEASDGTSEAWTWIYGHNGQRRSSRAIGPEQARAAHAPRASG